MEISAELGMRAVLRFVVIRGAQMEDVESMHDDEIVEVFVVDEDEEEGKGKKDERNKEEEEQKEDDEEGDEEQKETKKHEVGEQHGRKKFVCLEGEDHVVSEEGKCTVCENKVQVWQWCDSCQFYFRRAVESHEKVHTESHSHVQFASNPVVFDVRCNGCGRHSWTDFLIAMQECSCGGALEKKCPDCSEWFVLSAFRIHFSTHIRSKGAKLREGRANRKTDPPKRSREKAAEANAAKPVKKKEKKNNEKMAEKKDAVKKKAVTKKAEKKMGMPNVAPAPAPAPAPARNASFVDFVQSFRSKQKDVAAVAEVLKIVTDQMLDSEFFEQVDDQLFSELEQGRPIGVKQLLRKIRESKKQ